MNNTLISIWYGKCGGFGIAYDFFSSKWVSILLPFVVIYITFKHCDSQKTDKLIEFTKYWEEE